MTSERSQEVMPVNGKDGRGEGGSGGECPVFVDVDRDRGTKRKGGTRKRKRVNQL